MVYCWQETFCRDTFYKFNELIEYRTSKRLMGFILVVKQLAHVVEPIPPTSTGVKNEWNFISTPCSEPSWSGQGQLTFSTLLLMV
jgi:hypothetical protein